MFENKVLRKIFGTKRDEITGKWRKLHNPGNWIAPAEDRDYWRACVRAVQIALKQKIAVMSSELGRNSVILLMHIQ